MLTRLYISNIYPIFSCPLLILSCSFHLLANNSIVIYITAGLAERTEVTGEHRIVGKLVGDAGDMSSGEGGGGGDELKDT